MIEPWDVPSDWRWRRFQDVARVASNLVDPADYGDLPHIAPNHIEGETGRLLRYRTVREDGVISAKHRFHSGQILYSKIRPYLAKAVLVDFDGLCSADMYPIETDLDPNFLKWWMLSREFTRRAAGEQARTILPKINRRALEQLPVPTPPPLEQRRIVGILEDHLSRLDAAEHLIQTASLRLERLLLSTLTRSVTEMRQRGEPFMPLGDLTETSLGKMLDAKKADGELTRYLANVNVRWGKFDLTQLKRVPLTPSEKQRLRLERGDILACEGGEPGRSAVWELDDSDIAYQKALHRIRVLDPDALSPHFTALMLREAIQSRRWDSLFTGTTIKHLPQEKLRRIEIPVPPIAEQRALLAHVQEIDRQAARQAEALTAAKRRSQALRRGVMSAAFSGKLTGRSTDAEVVEAESLEFRSYEESHMAAIEGVG